MISMISIVQTQQSYCNST